MVAFAHIKYNDFAGERMNEKVNKIERERECDEILRKSKYSIESDAHIIVRLIYTDVFLWIECGIRRKASRHDTEAKPKETWENIGTNFDAEKKWTKILKMFLIYCLLLCVPVVSVWCEYNFHIFYAIHFTTFATHCYKCILTHITNIYDIRNMEMCGENFAFNIPGSRLAFRLHRILNTPHTHDGFFFSLLLQFAMLAKAMILNYEKSIFNRTMMFTAIWMSVCAVCCVYHTIFQFQFNNNTFKKNDCIQNWNAFHPDNEPIQISLRLYLLALFLSICLISHSIIYSLFYINIRHFSSFLILPLLCENSLFSNHQQCQSK